ncbi:hypothetical protein [Nonomuraea africana]|uniref:Uncharacterized protein n=1 Tax=Nonomuraea africana TaxID=46171 RepID=A0ABR9KPM5_9ACTN|nr:hypothetical protein [Nonomuraea africana]MBE1563988.1 hypothetical protein [Nonomuraea africana]
MCSTPIAQARTGRPARYCGTPCRQAAHRARRRPTETASRAARLRERLAADAAAVRQLVDELTAAIATIGAAGLDQDADAGAPNGRERDLAELTERLTKLVGSISVHVRDLSRCPDPGPPQ